MKPTPKETLVILYFALFTYSQQLNDGEYKEKVQYMMKRISTLLHNRLGKL